MALCFAQFTCFIHLSSSVHIYSIIFLSSHAHCLLYFNLFLFLLFGVVRYKMITIDKKIHTKFWVIIRTGTKKRSPFSSSPVTPWAARSREVTRRVVDSKPGSSVKFTISISSRSKVAMIQSHTHHDKHSKSRERQSPQLQWTFTDYIRFTIIILNGFGTYVSHQRCHLVHRSLTGANAHSLHYLTICVSLW